MAVSPRVVWMPGGVRTEIHLQSIDTAGAFCLLVDHPPPGWSLPLHLHRGIAETVHIVDGEFEMEVAGKHIRLKSRDTLHVPPDTLHTSANVGATEGERVLVFSPGGMERFFLEAGAPSQSHVVDPRAVLSAAQRNGWEFAGGSGEAADQSVGQAVHNEQDER
jgi:quercetin dioxygenase-like cupin family protein